MNFNKETKYQMHCQNSMRGIMSKTINKNFFIPRAIITVETTPSEYNYLAQIVQHVYCQPYSFAFLHHYFIFI
jgi:hypothetical protein